MLAANSIPLPVFDKNFFPKPPRENPGSFGSLRKFFDAYLPFTGQGHLTQTQISVLARLVKFADSQTGYCFPKRQSLAEEVGVDPATISKATAQLRDLGIIAKFGRGGFSASCDYIILFSVEAFALVKLIESGKFDRFRLRHRDRPLPVNLEEGAIDAAGDPEITGSCDPEITGSCDPRITRNELAQKNGYMASVDTQPENQERPAQAKRSGPRTPRLTALPEHWIEDAKQKRPDLDANHVASKFLAYHCKRGVRATTNWYSAWIRWVGRENTALDRRSTPKASPSATQTAATNPPRPATSQAGTARQPAPRHSAPAAKPKAPVAQSTHPPTSKPAPKPRTKPPVILAELLKRSVKTEEKQKPPEMGRANRAPTVPKEGPEDYMALKAELDKKAEQRWLDIMAREEARLSRAKAEQASQETPPEIPQEAPQEAFQEIPQAIPEVIPHAAPTEAPRPSTNTSYTPVGMMTDEERQRRYDELMASAEGKTLRDFRFDT